MRQALVQARLAAGMDGQNPQVEANIGADWQSVREQARGDIPIGAVILDEEANVIAAAGNRRESEQDPTAHAEILVLRQAAAQRGRWNLSGCTLVVTLEPCTMCAGAIVLSRIDTVVIGAMDPKAGAAGSLFNLLAEPRLNHQTEVISGVRGEECALVLKDFFAQLRKRRGRKSGPA
ncbi:nucleoside deaminase [Dermabacteraceae bacterium TAE3-ERU27]|nr:nucleoside deaminase [Dermabacteraceae bacterium TAE3-ERU27]